MSDKIVLIDGHSILSRAFYGIPDLTNAAGFHTNAIYGFLNILFKILEEEKPQYLAVAFDLKAPTFRHKMFEAYKGTRKPMPEELHMQVPVMKEVLQAMNVLIMEKEGYEADDILGTMAKRAQEQGLSVSLVSGDRDLLQISDKNIKIRIPKTRPGKTEVEDYYPEDVIRKYQVDPIQFIDVKALMGDSSDNIPGVPKVGEKTATELIVQYGSLDGVYEHLEEISKNSIRESLRENKELAYLCQKLARIDIDAEIPFEIKDAGMGELYNKKSYDLFKNLELKTFYSRFDKEIAAEEKKGFAFQILSSAEKIRAYLKELSKEPVIGLSVLDLKKKEEAEGQMSLFAPVFTKNIHGVGVSAAGGTAFLESADSQTENLIRESIHKLILSKKNQVSCANCKDFYSFLLNGEEWKDKAAKFTDGLFDPVIAAYLINPNKNDYSWQDISGEYLGEVAPTKQELFNKKEPADCFYEKKEEVARFYCLQSNVCFRCLPLLSKELEEQGMYELYKTMEMPLSLCLYEMEQQGIAVRLEDLREYGKSLTGRIEELEELICEEAGGKFNINSPKQLGEVLFEKLKLPGGKKTKSGYSTAADVLEGLAPDYPIVAHVLEYRGLVKLKSTYADGLENQIAGDGRIHTTYQQTVTATGRLSSTEPNLQNIPIRMELGRLIRKVFVPKDGCVFMDSDYSQIELRILAHMSEDKQLIEAYKMAEDIHAVTASQVFHVPMDQVTPLLRRNAKAVNFGIVYGISSFGLSQDLSISKKEAEQYIQGYFETYPGIKKFLDGCVDAAKKKGYSVTMYQRRRPIMELKSSQFMVRKFGERIAMNAPIQGTAADIMKLAMIGVRDALIKENLSSRILLQVHDELLLEVKKEEIDAVKKILAYEMENAAALSVPLDVDLHTGENWYDTK